MLNYQKPAKWDRDLNLVNIQPIDLEIIQLYARQEDLTFNCSDKKILKEFISLCHAQAGITGNMIIKQLIQNSRYN